MPIADPFSYKRTTFKDAIAYPIQTPTNVTPRKRHLAILTPISVRSGRVMSAAGHVVMAQCPPVWDHHS